MRILYVVPRYWPSVGGAQLHTRELVHRIATHNQVKVMTQFTSDRDSFVWSVVSSRPGYYQDGSIDVHQIGPDRAWRPILQRFARLYGRIRPINPIFAILLYRALLPQINAFIREYRPEVIHAIHIGLVYSSEIAYRAAKSINVPFVWTPLPHIEGAGWRGPRFQRLYHRSDAVIAMTERERSWLIERGAPAEKVHVIPVGPLIHPEYDAQAFRTAHNLNHAPMVLFLAQKLLYKGYQQLAEAAPLVWKQLPETRFVFVGPRTAESESFFATVTDQRIIELPAISDFEKSSALAACDLLCMPSTQESLGVVYLEAWSFKKPIIAADIEVTREVIQHGKDGLLVKQEAGAIAQAVIALLKDEHLRERLAKTGCQKVREKYSWERSVRLLERLYGSLIGTQFIRGSLA